MTGPKVGRWASLAILTISVGLPACNPLDRDRTSGSDARPTAGDRLQPANRYPPTEGSRSVNLAAPARLPAALDYLVVKREDRGSEGSHELLLGAQIAVSTLPTEDQLAATAAEIRQSFDLDRQIPSVTVTLYLPNDPANRWFWDYEADRVPYAIARFNPNGMVSLDVNATALTAKWPPTEE